jgi:hypothetical protein
MWMMRKIIFAALVVILLAPGESALAEIVKEISIESVPPGAKVYFPLGTRNKLLGTTPFVYSAEFHSKVSVLRLLVKKPLYEDQTIKIIAEQDNVRVILKPVSLTESPSNNGNASQRDLQTRVNAIVEKKLPNLMNNKGGIKFELFGPLTVTKEEDVVVAVLHFKLVDWRSNTKGNNKERQEALARTVWGELGPKVIVPLAQALKGINGLTGLAMDLQYDEQQFLFGVKPSVESHVEMQCVPGMRQELRSVVRYQDGHETMTTELQQVYDPCLRRIPVSRNDVKLDPQAAVQKSQARGLFLLNMPPGNKQEVTFEKLSVVIHDTNKEAVFQQGNIPSSLLVDQRYQKSLKTK